MTPASALAKAHDSSDQTFCPEMTPPRCERARGGLRVRNVRGYDRRKGCFPKRIAEQCRLAFSTGSEVLSERGVSLDDVVRVVYLVKDAGQLSSCAPFMREALGENRPATTVLIVDGFDRPDVEIEMELVVRTPDICDVN